MTKKAKSLIIMAVIIMTLIVMPPVSARWQSVAIYPYDYTSGTNSTAYFNTTGTEATVKIGWYGYNADPSDIYQVYRKIVWVNGSVSGVCVPTYNEWEINTTKYLNIAGGGIIQAWYPDTLYSPSGTFQCTAGTHTFRGMYWTSPTTWANVTLNVYVQTGVWADVYINVKDSATTFPINGANITFSNGRTGITNETGWTLIQTPKSSTITYSISKTGYDPLSGVPLGSVGQYGGYVYQALTPSLIPPASGNVTVNVDIRDSKTGDLVYDCQVGIQNTTSGEWRNKTSKTGMLYYDSTGPNYEYPLSIGEYVVFFAGKDGYYYSTTREWQIARDGMLITIPIQPLTDPAPTGDNFTAVISVSDMVTGYPIADASVSLGSKLGLTNGAGAITLRDIAVGNYTVRASKTNYQSASESIVGTAGQTVMKAIQLLPIDYTVDEDGNILDEDGEIVGSAPGRTGSTSGTSGTSGAGDLSEANVQASDAITVWLKMATGMGGLIFMLGFYWFVKKIQKE